MGRQFIDPATGDLHDESYYHKHNIDLATVLEYVELDGVVGFDIKVENIERMDVQAPEVFAIFADFTAALVQRSFETDDDKEREDLQGIAAYISKVMLGKLGYEKSSH